MTTLTRRSFLRSASLAAGTAALGGRAVLAEQEATIPPARIKAGWDIITLGKTGIKTSVLGMGTGTSHL